MGTAISIDLSGSIDSVRAAELADAAFAWFREVDARFSTYQDDSEVNRLQRGELSSADASPDLRHVLDECARLWRETDGYFDAYATGRLDPSGYVKGWSVQVASDRLTAAGAPDHCVNAGGDVRVCGRVAGQPWRIGIRHPFEPMQTCWVLAGTDLAVATSGNYERGFHVIDPLTGKPARALASVTVAGSDLGVADAYSTAAVAMGVKGIDWLARLEGYESAVVTEDGLAFRSEGLPVA
ncbi:FAD:protein FMN transferase [Rhizocola hellebori]|nr:FAD:protein FMN transferase [Rhizocola hellebori]